LASGVSNDAGPERLLPAEVEILPGVDVASLWDRFELFEALHHTAHNTADDTAHNTATPGPGAIATPMSSADLDGVVEAIAPQAGERALDLACGYGELLRRLRSRVMIAGRGVDLSPWMLAAAARTGETDLGWTLGGAKEYLARTPTPAWDIVCCLGASWIWYGLHGTIRAVAAATAPGGRVAIGDLHLRDGIDPETIVRSHRGRRLIVGFGKRPNGARINCGIRPSSPGRSGWAENGPPRL